MMLAIIGKHFEVSHFAMNANNLYLNFFMSEFMNITTGKNKLNKILML
jgi:hypothetical protein